MTTTSGRPTVVTRADWVPGPKQGQWTYQYYAALPNDGQRYEIIDGVLYMPPPSPLGWHQNAATLISTYLVMYVKFTGLGQVFSAPFDVELAPGTVVQPDVLVLLNESSEKYTPSRVIGAPDLVVEVASPSTAKYDREEKRQAYAQAGVREYWLVDPLARNVEVLVLEAGTYYSLGVFRGRDILPSVVVPNLLVQAEQFFA